MGNYCWEQSQSGLTCTPPRPIPGHHKPKRDRSGKSPKSPKSPRSPVDSSRSPKSDLVKMTDDDLRKLKISLITEDDSTNPAESSKKTIPDQVSRSRNR